MAIELYSESVRRRYYASRWSAAYLFTVVIRATLLTLPFFLAYTSTPSFWLKTNTYREQPGVEYEYKLLGVVQGLDAANEPTQAYYSSMSTVAYLFQSELRLPTVRSIHVDKNRDGLTDRFQLEALIPLRAGEKVLSSSVVAFFNVKLKRRARLEMETLAYSHFSSPLPGRALYVDGDYELRQRWPLRAKGGYQLPYENTPLLDDADLNVDKALLPKLLASYRARNVTMDLRSDYGVWSPDLGSDDAAHVFNLTINVRVPVADVLYTPTATEVLKDAWIKYLSVFVVLYFLLDRLCAFVFYFQLLPTTMAVDDPKV